jgi:hypothetical protein
MKYRYRAVERFWTSFYRLNPAQKDSARRAWKIFKEDPFDPRLRTHKIQRRSADTGAPFMPSRSKAICVPPSIWTVKRLSRSSSAHTTSTKVDDRPRFRSNAPEHISAPQAGRLGSQRARKEIQRRGAGIGRSDGAWGFVLVSFYKDVAPTLRMPGE